MNLLLDTHVLLWWIDGSNKLGSRAKAALSKPGASVWLSAASVWELVIKVNAGRLRLPATPDETVAALIESGCQPLPITVEHALAVRALPPHHADPFDRILIAQAQCQDLTIVTADSAIAAYNVRTIDGAV